MALSFLASSDFAYWTANSAAKIGGSTWLLIIRRTADSGGTSARAMSIQNAGLTQTSSFFFNGTDLLACSGGGVATTMNAKVADGWIAVAVTKATGSAIPRFHKYVYSTGVASHENGAGAVVDTAGGGAGSTMMLARLQITGGIVSTSFGDYAAAAMWDRVLTDSELETVALNLGAMKASQPAWGLWVFDHLTAQSNEFFIGSAWVSGSGAAVSSTMPPFGYGEPDLHDGTMVGRLANFTGTGHLTATSGTPSYPPAVLAQTTGAGSGFTFALVSPAQVVQDIHFTTTGNFTHDQNRSVRRAIEGFRLLPSEAAKVNMASDEVFAFLDVNGESFPMGVFRFTESSRVKDAIIDDNGDPADLIDVSLSDRFVMLQRSSESPVQVIQGSDPSQEMIRVLDNTAIPHSINGAVANIADNVVWQPFTTEEEIVSQLAEIAGHRRPWADNYGVIRSVTANVIDTEVIDLESELHPVAGSIVVTENYLSAPNRVVVFDDQGAFPIVGSWDAPASAPNSFVNRGWILTTGIPQQGLSGALHAQQVARAVGEQLSARTMTCQILPTNRLDGPVVVSWDDALWLTESWSVSSAPGALMSASFRELIIEQGTSE